VVDDVVLAGQRPEVGDRALNRYGFLHRDGQANEGQVVQDGTTPVVLFQRVVLVLGFLNGCLLHNVSHSIEGHTIIYCASVRLYD